MTEELKNEQPVKRRIGRPKGAKNKIQREQRKQWQVRAFPHEILLIKEFVKIVRADPEQAEKVLRRYKPKF